MPANKTRTNANTVATIDRITRDLLAQLELQTQVVLTLLERAPEAQREAHLERLADLRGRLVKLRHEMLGSSKPKLVSATKGGAPDEPT
jgi:hypothetical protein